MVTRTNWINANNSANIITSAKSRFWTFREVTEIVLE